MSEIHVPGDEDRNIQFSDHEDDHDIQDDLRTLLVPPGFNNIRILQQQLTPNHCFQDPAHLFGGGYLLIQVSGVPNFLWHHFRIDKILNTISRPLAI